MDPLELQPSHEQKIEHKALLRRRLITGFRTPVLTGVIPMPKQAEHSKPVSSLIFFNYVRPPNSARPT